MSLKTTNRLLREFLVGEPGDALALTGSWGVGKTYAWNEVLKSSKDQIKLKQYSYVSLFGISTMAELRMAVFVKSRAIETLGKPLTIDLINKDWMILSNNAIRGVLSKFGGVLKSVPHGAALSLGLEAIAPNFVRDMLVCFDDFERQKSLKLEDILGFISELKEEKGCKVALIFNADKLDRASDYRSYKEKVVDIEVFYDPTVEESFNLVFASEVQHRDLILRHLTDLEINNVRVLRRIHKVISLIRAEAANMHEVVMESAISTVVLLCWCAYAPEPGRPKIEEIETWNKSLITAKPLEDRAVSQWVNRLKTYGFIRVDDLDIAIAKVVEYGYAEGTGFRQSALALHDQAVAAALSVRFSELWAFFRDESAGDAGTFAADLYAATCQAIGRISMADLNATVVVFRQLQRDDLADGIIQEYIEARPNNPEQFDLSSHPFGGSIDDQRLRERFTTIANDAKKPPTVIETLKYMCEFGSYSTAQLHILEQATADEFFDLFMNIPAGLKFGDLMAWTLRWNDSEMQSISDRAREALVRVGRTSLLNKARVSRYGVII